MKWLLQKVEINAIEMLAMALVIFALSSWFWVPMGTLMEYRDGDLVLREINEEGDEWTH